ncbi:aaa atpase domain containing protein [Ophiostoma piceae UAMH 11346]|uniref:Aaa atpase domain containing protein n=1 Tax=Ophiostoma piceae (strain UAMH 11346) TaxID=1262450 RepID=S3CGQ4_OPHP1|nr:aaa atpase domain containing protein [Ophiostoma piceae UAMH 11346]
MAHRLNRPALGQKFPLGTLYNAHNDTFQNLSLFSEHPVEDAIVTTWHQKSDTTLNNTDSYRGRLALLGAGPEFEASLFSGLAVAGGCGRCLQEHSPIGSPTTVQHYAALGHKLVTVEDSLLPNNPALRGHVVPEVLQNSTEATHVVVSIIWGSQSVIVARGISQHSNSAADNATQATGQNPEGAFENAVIELRSAVDNLQYLQNAELGNTCPEGIKLDVVAYSEVFDGDGMVLNGLGEAFDLIRLLPTLLRNSGRNAGKGEPVMYCLLPIPIMAKFLGLQGKAAVTFRANICTMPPSPHDFLDFILEQFSEVEIVWTQLVSYAGMLARHKPYVRAEHAQDVLECVSTARKGRADLKQEFARMLIQGRMHGPSPEAMDNLTHNLQTLQTQCIRLLEVAGEQVDKVSFSRMAVARGAIYIGHNGLDMEKIICAAADTGRDAYVLMFSRTAMTVHTDGWDANVALLKDLLPRTAASTSSAVVILVDCDAVGQALEHTRIVHYNQQGVIVTQDLYEQRQFIAGQCIARCNAGALETDQDIKKPIQRRMVKIPCPGPDCSNLEVCQWICSACHSQIEFGYTDDFMYCDCGRAKYNAWRFKCNSPNHQMKQHEPAKGQSDTSRRKAGGQNISSDGYAFYRNKAQLLSTLKSLDQTDYVNILILGETGVGKSTFINSLVNYLAYETLDEAKHADELSWVIPCSFSIQTMDRSRPNGAIKERKVQVGGRDDEKDGSSGDSATQKTAVYPVNVGDKTIRLIDTPGIGDTRGLEFDKKNMADILRTLSSYEHLHGILILLKSNNSRLTVTFNFCMQELLTHLHRSASRNMAFGFTNTRISNYSPGDTFGPLSSLLDKHRDIGLVLENQNTFCFDSESFRYLAAFKKSVVMENEEDFRRSWVHSREEAVRLIEYFQSKTPHQVKSTLSMNGTRQLIAELTKPMADISQIINANIKVLGEQIAELSDTRLSGNKLRQRLQVPKVHLRAIKLQRPRTVCRNEDCVEWRDDGTGELKGVYKKPCHDPCYLNNVEVDRINCPELLHCAAFGNICNGVQTGFCTHVECGHSWQEHMHICYELEEYTAMVTDTEAQRLFAQNESDIIVKQAALHRAETNIREYRAEHTKIQEAAARFGIFLKKHSITLYNDATLEYLDMLIDEEKQKSRVSRQKSKLEALRNSRAAHIELVKTLESSMATCDGAAQLDEAGVEALVQSLYDLEHFGKMLRDVKEGVVEAYQATYRERPFRVQTPRRRADGFRSSQRAIVPSPPPQQRYPEPEPYRGNYHSYGSAGGYGGDSSHQDSLQLYSHVVGGGSKKQRRWYQLLF